MRTPLAGALAAIATVVSSAGPHARAAVDLELRAERETFGVGSVVDVGLYAVSDEGTVFSGLDVLITWDPAVLGLSEPAIDNGPHDWSFVFGFLSDEQLDRLNADCGEDVFCDPYTSLPFNDGDAMFQAASFSSATATAEGVLVATFRFNALSETPLTEIAIVDTLGGQHSVTRVLQPGGMEVTGNLSGASITILGMAALSVWDLSAPAGRIQAVVVSGTVSDRPTFGVEIVAELVARPGNTGTVTFTEAPPVDILQVGDPWPMAGVFTPFDTDLSSSPDRNGSIDDSGSWVPVPVTFSGALTVFPVVTSADAQGVWDMRLSTSYGTSSFWQELDTTLRDGTLTIVELGNGNGDAAIDMFDFSEFQLCFTGRLDPIDPPAYGLTPGLSCGVYDFDDDGDIDDYDYAAFQDVALGPAP
ncbi:MAG: hypothetical protein JSU86_00390 [Phycisphaerales bacterium]|nr:MAG: hypothetical protein JSU86_00390 [Phycisphaerales bacterium]